MNIVPHFDQHCVVVGPSLFLLRRLRSELMLPDNCPYLKVVCDDLKRGVSKKRSLNSERQEYDLTKSSFGCNKSFA